MRVLLSLLIPWLLFAQIGVVDTFYTGDGDGTTDPRTVLTATDSVKLVLVTAWNVALFPGWKTPDMSNVTQSVTGFATTTSGGIVITGTGNTQVQVDSSWDGLNILHHVTAFYGESVHHGTFAGTGSGVRVETGFQPRWLFISEHGVGTTQEFAGYWYTTIGDLTHNVDGTAINCKRDSTGFTLATTTGGHTYYWVAFSSSPNYFYGEYLGDGTDDRWIDIDNEVEFLYVTAPNESDAGAGVQGTWKSRDMFLIDTCGIMSNDPGYEQDRIQEIDNSNTQFQVGTVSNNKNEVYLYWGITTTVDTVLPKIYVDMNYNEVQITGNGNATRAVSLGFQPDVVFIAPSEGATSRVYAKSYEMGGDSAMALYDSTLKSDRCTITSTGITLGSHLNKNTIVYNISAFDSDTNGVLAGRYVGDGTFRREVNLTENFRPAVVFTMANDDTLFGKVKSLSLGGIDTLSANTYDDALGGNGIKVLNHNKFITGNGIYINKSGITYHWIAFAEGQWFDGYNFAGSGSSNVQKAISNLFQGDIYTIYEHGNYVDSEALWKNFDFAVNSAAQIAGAYVTNQLDTVTATYFVVDENINSNYLGIDFYWFALGGYEAPGEETPTGQDRRQPCDGNATILNKEGVRWKDKYK
jgi:hypothetical protein